MASILIAEARAVDRNFLVTLLGHHGHTMLEASDGGEALDLVRRRRPHLVISDVLMPTMDGYEFVCQMRAIPEVADTPVIFYTANYHGREARALAERCGVRAIITKPSESAAILAKVDAALGCQRPVVVAPPDGERFDLDHHQLVNQKLLEKVQRLAEAEHRLSALVDIGRRFAHERDPRAVLQHVCTSARDITLASHATLVLLSEDGTSVGAVFMSGVDADRLKEISPGIPSADMLSELLEKRTPVRRPSGRRTEGPDRETTTADASSYLGVPIASAACVYGWLSLSHKLGADEFTKTDEEMVATLAGQAGVAYESARLYNDLQWHVSALEQEVAERRRLEVRTEFALAAARIGIGETDLDTGRMIWSESKSALFGIALASFGGTTEAFFALVHPEDRPALRQEVAAALANGSHDLVTEFRTIWPDGSLHWVQDRARIAYDPAGRPLRALGVGLDVTDRKLLEAQFRQSQKMEAIGMLAGGVAHDFNNMLTVILGFSELLAEQIRPDKPIGRDLKEIVGAAQRAAALTRQLLAFSRKQVLVVTPLDLTTVVREVESMLRRLLGEQITIKTELADDLDPVTADVTQLEQVLMNLSVNARDAMPKGGVLTLATRNITLDRAYAAAHPGANAGSCAALSVSDTGTGMSPETRERIFEPFFTTKERGQGTGLGLAAVYGIVKQMNGYIEVESHPARGSTFTIYLPRTEQAAEAATGATITMSPVGRETILLVEDEVSVRAFTKIALERFGYQVLEAATAEGALRILDDVDITIHLLLTDIVLPGIDGHELALKVARHRPQLPVLFMSGYTTRLSTIDGLLEPGVQLLEKPFTAHTLLTKTRQILGTTLMVHRS
ncbi:MAG: hypothetical protein DMF92_10330 [Acidobacteria bacterium]|nr:MAG: hypothetical protein DMF92_10330 [Acidobacteriota bacterium]